MLRYRLQTADQNEPENNSHEPTAIYESKSTSLNSKITVDRIQKVAALGFEASKISNILARFSTENEVYISNSEKIENILSKFIGKYHYLKQFQLKSSLQATIICDLAISLSPNHQIAFNMLNVLTKMWSTSDSKPNAAASQSVIGYLEFLPNLVDSVQTLATHSGETVSCLTFLSDSTLSTNKNALLASLTRKDTLLKLNETPPTDYESHEKLKLFVPTFTALLRIPTDSNNIFKRVSQFVFNMLKLLQLDNHDPNQSLTNELLQLDLKTEIGKMVFDKEICPNDLEANTCSVHLNLVYELALNLSAPILSVQQRDSDKSSIEQLLQNVENQNHNSGASTTIHGKFTCQNAIVYDYISKHSSLLGYLLQNIVNQRSVEFFGCQNNFIENMMKAKQIDVLSNMFEGNILWTLLSFDNITEGSVANFVANTQDEP